MSFRPNPNPMSTKRTFRWARFTFVLPPKLLKQFRDEVLLDTGPLPAAHGDASASTMMRTLLTEYIARRRALRADAEAGAAAGDVTEASPG